MQSLIAFGKNEQIKKVFWTLFVAIAGLVLARVVDPVTAQQVVGIIKGGGVMQALPLHLSSVEDAGEIVLPGFSGSLE